MALNSPVDFFSSDNPRSKPLKDPLTSTLAYAGFSSALSYNTKGHHFVVASREELKLRRTHIDVVDGDALVVSDLYREGPKSIELKTVRRHLNTVLRPTFVAMKEAFF